MEKEQIDFLRDVQAFIEHGIKNGLTFQTIVKHLDADFEKVKAAKLNLTVFGYRNISEGDFGESGE